MEPTWKSVSFRTDGSQESTVKILNALEDDGWEPRTIKFWERVSMADPNGVTIYARKKA
jgi:hypothetical protein